MKDKIVVKGAREHNLKNIDVEFPRNKFVVITGLSGSGKSTLAFDTIYSEGNRRYVESLSAYARQFLGNISKPDVDSIDGLSPAISIEQKTTSKNPRSTVGTVTEIYDYLRLLFARVGTSFCPKCDEQIKPQSAENIVNLIMSEKDKKLIILAPIIRGLKGTYEKVFVDLLSKGFSKVRVDGDIYSLDTVSDEITLERYEKHYIEVIIDRIKVNDDLRQRINDSVEQALNFGSGTLIILDVNSEIKLRKKFGVKLKEKDLKEIQRKCEILYSSFGACPNHPEVIFEKPEPRQFSFNSPFGACNVCLGLGSIYEFDENLIIPDKNLSISNGAISMWKNKIELNWQIRGIKNWLKKYDVDIFTPLNKISKKAFLALLYGDSEIIQTTNSVNRKIDGVVYEGIIPMYKRLHRQTESSKRRDHFEKYMTSCSCNACNGMRLKENILAIKIDNKSIIEITDFNVSDALIFFKNLTNSLTEKEKFIAKQVLKEIIDRLDFLNNVGLSYLNLSRSAGTLSGGEAQRIRLATQIGANLMGVLYVLDEPSIGLHQRDNEKLIETLHKLRDLGNTLLVVEHDEDTMKSADYLIDMGPGAGVNGGHVVASGTPKQVMNNKKSETGDYLSGRKKIEVPKIRRDIKNSDFIVIKGARENNLKNLSVELPTKMLCGITGVSGSGKSTLITQTLVPLMKKHFNQVIDKVPKYKSIKIPDNLDNIVVIDQSPIGKTPRSNPATYVKVFDDIRKIFSQTKDSKVRGYQIGRFSFNVKGGRCETCSGDGLIKIEMSFLPDVYVKCDDCQGKRYNRDTLEIMFKGKNIAEILDMDVDTAVNFFENHSSIYRKVKTLQDVGLGYIKLGQPSTQLSGGEAQRIKLTKELAKFKKGKTLYFLDEPTTGLHFEDVKKLLDVMNRLIDKGNSIFVIEHNLDVIKSCDYIIDIGPEGGSAGGQIVATGTPEKISKVKNSYTGHFLKNLI